MKLHCISVVMKIVIEEKTTRVIIFTPNKLPKYVIKALEEYDSGDEENISILVYPDMIILESFGMQPMNIRRYNNSWFKQLSHGTMLEKEHFTCMGINIGKGI